jgi:cell volume regulation protein A
MRIPSPLLWLVAAALLPVPAPAQHAVEAVVSVALVVILFDGGRGIGLERFRTAAVPVLSLGLVGTFATVVGAAMAAHLLLDVSWYFAVLVATAVAPTDPAVVFSVLGGQQIEGRSGTVLEGESGANDPVGIALMAALLDAGSLSGHALGDAAVAFALQLVVGTLVGVVAGSLLRPLPNAFALLVVPAAFVLADLGHGSGFLAVFVAAIIAGQRTAHVHPLVGTTGEAVAFVALGLTVPLGVLGRTDVLLPAVALALAVVVVRFVVCWPLLAPTALSAGERRFVLLSGLKGAVPLLLGSMIGDARLYAVTVVVVVLSVLVQGALVPRLTRDL